MARIPNFKEATYTAVISDLHLCEAEEVHPKFPYWKKYKTRQFFFDEEFALFLEHIESKSSPEKVELVLNGDIFDFDSVTSIPEMPPYRISWLEKKRGLSPQKEKSEFKIKRILDHHGIWVNALRNFAFKGHRIIFIIGNHDLELHFPSVQKIVLEALDLPEDLQQNVRFNEWFYISNKDTLIEHGNQYDPYCLIQDPVNPFIQRFNRVEVRVPFGNLATRYLINGMGFFNPHVNSNFIMSAKEYTQFFFKYMLLAQPLLMWDWLWGASVTLFQAFMDRLIPSIKDPLTIEDRVETIAKKANATSRMVRELKEHFEAPAASYPMIIARELWLDRAFIVTIAFFIIFQVMLVINTVYSLSFFWMFIPLFLFLPFFFFYSSSVHSDVTEFQEPKEMTLKIVGLITKVSRIVYGHTHQPRHESIGAMEYLNCGTWSPAFRDVECERPFGAKTFVWIEPAKSGERAAAVLEFSNGKETKAFV
ncbi:MAG: metallophosphoesterase [Bdellovibrionales bacterium]|nr:metallophosphoesterase [Bdellovibrionales bacterium]